MYDAVFLHDVLRVEDEPLADPVRKFGGELVKRCVALVPAALDFDGAYHPVTPYQEIDLQFAAVRLGISPRVEEKASS